MGCSGRLDEKQIGQSSRISVDVPTSVFVPAPKDGPRRKANFGATLTRPGEVKPPNSSTKHAEKRIGKGKQRLLQGDDLTQFVLASAVAAEPLSTQGFRYLPAEFLPNGIVSNVSSRRGSTWHS